MKTWQVVLFALAACLLYGIGAGIRGDIGILLQPVLSQTGLSYERASFCIAVMQLVFGASQPVFGLVASRKSNRFVIILGSLLIIAGLLGIRASSSFLPLFVSLSVVFGLGAGAVSFGLVFTSAVYFAGKDYAMLISGMLNAAAGMTGFVLSPVLNSLLDAGGLSLALLVVPLFSLLMIPIALAVTSRDPKNPKKEIKSQGRASSLKDDKKSSALSLFTSAFSNRTYRLLVAGFSTCGFHMVIIESHLFSQFKSYGISGNAASWAFSIYGIATILGALLSGFLSAKIDKGRLLSFYYGFRAVWVGLYLFLLPKNIFTAALFSAGLGMTGDATVSPTSGLVNQEFSIEKVATLVGFLFLCHQAGAFFSAWAGGLLLKTTGGYNAVWLIDIALCVFASLMSARISRNSLLE